MTRDRTMLEKREEDAELERRERKEKFIKELAAFLTRDAIQNSVALAGKNRYALKWAALRDSTPLFGYPTQEEAEAVLTEFLK